MKVAFFIMLSLLILVSCSRYDDYDVITMLDGNVLIVNKTNKYYYSEEEFIQSMTPSFKKDNDIIGFENVEYQVDSIYKVFDFDQSIIDHWETVSFGEWVVDYGLAPYKTYYVATKKYMKYISYPQNDLSIFPFQGENNMGFWPGIKKSTFMIQRDAKHNTLILITGFRLIGYDSDRKNIGKEFPVFINDKNERLTWHFKVYASVWD